MAHKFAEIAFTPVVRAIQVEDEIAAMGSAIGAAFGGAFSLTGTSGPGVCLKSEAIGLAIMMEIPVVILNVQRGGPSTGLPTKTEQSDLLQAFFGRNGESPLPILAASSPADCFDVALEAFRIAVRHTTPVFVLSESHVAQGAEPWRIPELKKNLPKQVNHNTLMQILAYLEESNKISVSLKGVTWTHQLSNKLARLERRT